MLCDYVRQFVEFIQIKPNRLSETQQHHYYNCQKKQQSANSILKQNKMTWESESDQHYEPCLEQESAKALEDMLQRQSKQKPLVVSSNRWPELGEFFLRVPDIKENRESNRKILNRLNKDENPTKFKLNNFQTELYSIVKSYKDVLFTHQTFSNSEDLRTVYCLHALTHLMKARTKIIKNNKIYEEHKYSEVPEDTRDQGFTRPKILFLAPTRNTALRIARKLTSMLEEKFSISKMDKLEQEFCDDEGCDGTDDDGSLLLPKKLSKPRDYYETFHGNVDDAFKVGMKLTKKNLLLYTEFYNSDIILASPLGLKTVIAAENPSKSDHDFLSSIELVVLDQTDMFLMQNWEHVLDILQHLNLNPNKRSKQLTTDMFRIRMWALDGFYKFYRQLIVFSSISAPLIHGLFQKHSSNYEGSIFWKEKISRPAIMDTLTECKQEFMFFESTTPSELADERFKFFTEEVLPELSDEHMKQTLICCSSYFDYVRLRNYFRSNNISFTQICEYSEEGKVAKARNLFYHGARHFLLYTERCHYYHRYKFKGVRHILFYEAPLYSKFYSELNNMLSLEMQGKRYHNEEKLLSSTLLFSKFDIIQLSYVVGGKNAIDLITNKKSIKE